MKDSSYYELPRCEIASLIVGTPKKILEIGCAAGNFKRNITWDCEYHGVEPVSAAAEKARSNGVIVHVGTYDDVKDELPDNYFDLIVANDVIEHMPQPWDFLRSIKSKMNDKGYIIGSVPNVRYVTNLWQMLIKKDWRYADGGVLDITHFRFFTPKSFARTLRECHFDIEFLKPSGPGKYAVLKKFLSIFAFPFGTDILYMQIAFRARSSATDLLRDR